MLWKMEEKPPVWSLPAPLLALDLGLRDPWGYLVELLQDCSLIEYQCNLFLGESNDDYSMVCNST